MVGIHQALVAIKPRIIKNAASDAAATIFVCVALHIVVLSTFVLALTL
jgi:hypothetical protein